MTEMERRGKGLTFASVHSTTHAHENRKISFIFYADSRDVCRLLAQNCCFFSHSFARGKRFTEGEIGLSCNTRAQMTTSPFAAVEKNEKKIVLGQFRADAREGERKTVIISKLRPSDGLGVADRSTPRFD